jgi:hypothetical protein
MRFARTDSLAGGAAQPSDAVLVEGAQVGFYAGTTLAALGALTALVLIRAKAVGEREPRAEDLGDPWRSRPPGAPISTSEPACVCSTRLTLPCRSPAGSVLSRPALK